MKHAGRRQSKEAGGKAVGNSHAEPVHLGTPKTIRDKTGKVRKQYPARPGYHGSADESALSPEE